MAGPFSGGLPRPEPTTFHLAQLNLARFRLPAADPANADYLAALAEVDAAAEGRPGLVWRMREAGQVATDDADPRTVANLSVWTGLDALADFVYRDPAHRGLMRRRRDWFDRMEISLVLWWVPAGHAPTLAEGRDRLALLGTSGPTERAFTFSRAFPPPG